MSSRPRNATRNRSIGVAMATLGAALVAFQAFGPGAALLAVGGWLICEEPLISTARPRTNWTWAGKTLVAGGLALFLVVFALNLSRT